MRVQNQYRSTKSNGAFTLIELLIVVAIIAILAAIAVPNFMEAQVRSKVSRSKADMRALATAMETYRIDNRIYPPVGDATRKGHYVPYAERLVAITTPIAYITSFMVDPFARPEENELVPGDPHRMGMEFIYSPGNLYHGAASRYDTNAFRGTIYSIAGRGPDKRMDYGYYSMAHPAAFESKINQWGQYDPTNGTVSVGDLFLLNCARM